MSDKNDKQEGMIDYLRHCVSENLNHARHVENERLTFTSIYAAMIVGAVAVVFGLEDRWIAFYMTAILSVFALSVMQLNRRWQGVFDDHMHKAGECQRLWERALKGEKITLPQKGYYFDGYTKPKGLRCLLCFLFGFPAEPEKSWNPLSLVTRTRHLFALLYLTVAVALIVLSVYLRALAIEAPIGGGFYIPNDIINALQEILAEVRK